MGQVVGAGLSENLVIEPTESNEKYLSRTPEGLFELHVRDAELSSVLRMLSVEGKRNIIASPDGSARVTADLYDVTFNEALEAVLTINRYGFRELGKFIYVYPLSELQTTSPPEQQMTTRVFTLAYLPAGEAAKLTQGLLSSNGSATATTEAASGLTGDSDTAGNALAIPDSLIVRDYADRIAHISAVLEKLDVRPKQVLIEATILRAALNEQNELGIDFNTLAGVDFQMLSSSSPGVTDLTTGALPQSRFNNTSITTRTDFNASITPGGFTFGIIKDQVAVFIRALEQVTDTTVLANPKILTLNKQAGVVIVGRRDGYLTTTVTETAAVQTVKFLETGTQLRFRPFIGRDGWVRLELHPKDSNGGLTADNLPFEETTEVTTNLLVRDGHTVVIGGLFRESTTSGKNQVPWLGNIPGLGLLFRNSNDQTRREEVIILLTVHVLDDGENEDAAANAVVADVERVRLGARRGVLGIGRQRLAQAHYRTAVKHQNAGRHREALRDVEMTLHNNPRHLRALKLRERLLGERLWGDDGGQMRTFIWQLINPDHDGDPTPFGRENPLREPPRAVEPEAAHDE